MQSSSWLVRVQVLLTFHSQWHGSNSYAGGGYGNSFHLDSWLDDYNKKAAGNTVNCYDQAAIVQLTTLLGVPDGRIRWMFKEPFGYIKDTDLVGWGETNNVSSYEAKF
jgi:hypothetical protein